MIKNWEKLEQICRKCKIFTLKNEEVKLVAGEFSNFKITTPIDYKLAQAITN